MKPAHDIAREAGRPGPIPRVMTWQLVMVSFVALLIIAAIAVLVVGIPNEAPALRADDNRRHARALGDVWNLVAQLEIRDAANHWWWNQINFDIDY
jgi:hypothetical protein